MNIRHFVLLLAAVLGLGSLYFSDTEAGSNEGLYGVEKTEASISPIYRYDVTDDTLFTTTNDTFELSTKFVSLWAYNHTADLTATGAMVVHFTVQESNEDTGGQWYELERDTVTFSGAGTLLGKLDGSLLSHVNNGQTVAEQNTLAWVKGRKQRLVLDIVTNSGGDTLLYDLDLTYKKQ